MAFVSLMKQMGYLGKIRQRGIHVWTVLWCEFQARGGGKVVISANVDNTYGLLWWEKVEGEVAGSDWLADVGEGAQIAWYNSTARSPEQAGLIQACMVGPAARARISAQVRSGLGRNAPGDQ